MKPILYSLFLFMAMLVGCRERTGAVSEHLANQAIVGGGCDGCEIMYNGIPQKINDTDTSAAWFEPGTKLVVTGTVVNLKKEPASGVIIYYWQTDNDGYYSKSAGEQTNHGHVRGWVKTGKNGKFTIYTIRPASYPNSTIPAHVHFSIKEPKIGYEYYIDDLLFDDDKFLTENERLKLQERGGNGISEVHVKDGVQYAERNINLGQNIPDYPAN